LQKEPLETESSLRGILRGFGLKVGKTTPVGFEGRIRELVARHPSLEVITLALLSVRAVLRRQSGCFEKRLRAIARTDNAGTTADDNTGRRRHRGVRCRPGGEQSSPRRSGVWLPGTPAIA